MNPRPAVTACIGLLCLAGGLGADVPPYADARDIRCVSNYIPDPNINYDVSAWKRDLDGMKAAGLNAVWMVNVWKAFVPSVESGKFDTARISWLKAVCREAAKRDMKVLLVLGYVGEGWAPEGIDDQVWWLKPADFGHYKSFIRRMAAETKSFDNVVYMLADEETLSATILYNPDKREECVESFRAWAYSANPDITYWNGRWKTDYTWDTLSPANTKSRATAETWVDHYRWFAHILRTRLGELVVAIRAEKTDAIVGFHDFLIAPNLKELRETGLPSPNPFNFYSIGWYYAEHVGDIDANIKAMEERIAHARTLVPDRPPFMGELGADISKVGEAGQKEFLSKALALLKREKIGYSIWNWRHYIEGGSRVFSLLDEKGIPRTALKAVSQANHAHD